MRVVQALGVFAVVLGGFLVSLPDHAHAYSTYIRLGYANCTACHASPRGGGVLSDYGNGIAGASALLSREITPRESFLGMSHAIQSRAMHLERESGRSTFLMQLDYLNLTQLSARVRSEVTLGLTSPRVKAAGVAGSGLLGEHFILRKALVTFRMSDQLEVSAGRDLLPTGLNLDDHTAYSRALGRRGVTDYPTQLRLELSGEKAQLTPYLFAPSFEENVANREWGVGTRLEYALKDDLSLGADVLLGRSGAIERRRAGVFSRLGLGHRSAVLAEYQLTARSLLVGADGVGHLQHTFYARYSYALVEWLEAGPVFERFLMGSLADSPSDQQSRYGLSAYARFSRELTLILDGRVAPRGESANPYFALQGFLHL